MLEHSDEIYLFVCFMAFILRYKKKSTQTKAWFMHSLLLKSMKNTVFEENIYYDLRMEYNLNVVLQRVYPNATEKAKC